MYHVFCDSQEHYSIREVFYEGDSKLIDYGKSPVAALSNSPEELMQLIQYTLQTESYLLGES